MKRMLNALLYGSVMFGTSFLLVASAGVIGVIAHDVKVDEDVDTFLLREASMAGSVTGAAYFLVAYFGAHRRIGPK